MCKGNNQSIYWWVFLAITYGKEGLHNLQRTNNQIDILKIIMDHKGITSGPVSSLAANSKMAAAKLAVSMKSRGTDVPFEMDMDVKTSWKL